MRLIATTMLLCAAAQGVVASDDDRALAVRELIYELHSCRAWAECGGTWLDLKREAGDWKVVVRVSDDSPEDLAAAHRIKADADRFIATYRPILETADRDVVRASVPLGFRESVEAAATREALQRRRITAKYKDYELAEVLTSLSHLSGVAIDSHWKALGIAPTAWVSVDANDESLEHVLKQLVSILDNGRCMVVFTVDGSRVVLTTDAARRSIRSVAVYDVCDLLEFEARTLPPDANGNRPAVTLDHDVVMQRLLDIIVEFVDTRGWDMMGGTTGVLRSLDGWLFALNPAESHRAIERLFAAMSEAARGGYAVVGRIDDLNCSPSTAELRIYDLVDVIHARLPRPTSATLGEWNMVRADLMWNVMELIVDEVDTEGWNMMGGTKSVIREHAGLLFVSTTADNHRAIERLLAAVRAGR